MQYINIKQICKDENTVFTVSALFLRNSTNTIVQKIPHPLGTDILEFTNIEDAKQAICQAGFAYVLPNGVKYIPEKEQSQQTNDNTNVNNYSEIIFNLLKKKIKSNIPSVSANAIEAITDFPSEETYTILFSKLGEDNASIRNNAINGIVKHAQYITNNIIEALKSPEWVVRNSILTSITLIAETTTIDIENFIIPVIESCDDTNPIVQTNAINTLSKLYQRYQNDKNI